MTTRDGVLELFDPRDPNMLRALRVGLWAALAFVLGGTAAWYQLGALRYSAALGRPATAPAFAVTPIDAFVIAIGVVLLPTLALIGGGPAIGRLRLARGSLRRWAEAVFLAALVAAGVMTFLGTQQAALATVLPTSWSSGTAGEAWRSAPAQVQWINAVTAGIPEEFAYVVAPIATWCAIVALVDGLRRRSGRPVLSHRVYVIGIVATAAICVLLRFNLHTYQGLLPALLAVVWSGVNVALFLKSRSLLALVLAHTFYNGAIAGTLALGDAPTAPWLALTVAIAAAIALVVSGRRRDAAPTLSRAGG